MAPLSPNNVYRGKSTHHLGPITLASYRSFYLILSTIHLPAADELSDKPHGNGPAVRYSPISATRNGAGEEKGNWNLNEKSDGLCYLTCEPRCE